MDSKPVSSAIEHAHAALLHTLPFEDVKDFQDADRGFLAALDPAVIRSAEGRVVWDNDSYAFRAGDAPTSARSSTEASCQT